MGKHTALANLDACVMRSSEDQEMHRTMELNGMGAFCHHTHSAWGEPCFGCGYANRGSRKKEKVKTSRNPLTRLLR